ncbi:MAG: hypothetical protein N2C12_04455, partial [Planctomycetales bacterium]
MVRQVAERSSSGLPLRCFGARGGGTARRRHSLPGAFTLVEILAVIALIVVLMGILLPTVGAIRSRARSTECQNNLGQLGIAYKRATSSSPNAIRAEKWAGGISKHLEGAYELFVCPSDIRPEVKTSYGVNNRVQRMQDGDSRKIVALDYNKPVANVVVASLDQQDDWKEEYSARHSGSVNVLFYDASVDSFDPEDIDPRYCDPLYGFWRPVRDVSLRLVDCQKWDGSGANSSGGSGSSPSTDGSGSDGTDGTDGTDG